VPGWSLEPGQARLEFEPDVTVDELRGLGIMLGVDLRKPDTVKNNFVTPTQAIKNKKVDAGVISAYASRKPAGVTLKPDTGKAARKVFGK
jgi:4-aminobutyrate aminotransferase-like enzyme